MDLIQIASGSGVTPAVKDIELRALDALIRRFAAGNAQSFLPLIAFIVSTVKRNETYTARSLECLSSAALALKDAMLPELPGVAKVVISTMQKTLKRLSSRNKEQIKICSAGLKCLTSLAGSLRNYLTKYLSKMIGISLHPKLDGDVKAQVSTELDELTASLASIDARQLLEPLAKAYNDATKVGGTTTIRYLRFLEQFVGTWTAERGECAEYHAEVWALLMRSLDLRATGYEMIHEVEDAAIQATIQLIMKMQDDQLKPIFMKLLDWVGSPASQPKIHLARSITFWRFMYWASTTFGEMWIPYSGVSMHCLVECLGWRPRGAMMAPPRKRRRKSPRRKTKDPEPDSTETLQVVARDDHILNTAAVMMEHCGEKFVDTDKFKLLMPTMCSQISDGLQIREPKAFIAFGDDVLSPALVALSRRANTDDRRIRLTREIIKHHGHLSPEVKCVMAGALCAVFERNGPAFLAVLPDLIPVVA